MATVAGVSQRAGQRPDVMQHVGSCTQNSGTGRGNRGPRPLMGSTLSNSGGGRYAHQGRDDGRAHNL